MPHPPDDMTINTDPNIIKGPRRHCPPKRDLENGDCPSGKKTRQAKTSRPTKVKSVAEDVTAEEPCEDTPHSCPHPHPCPTKTNENLEDTDSTHDESDDAVSNKSNEDKPEEEDDVTKLSMCSITSRELQAS